MNRLPESRRSGIKREKKKERRKKDRAVLHDVQERVKTGLGRYQTERWQQLVGREFGGKNESKHYAGE